MIWFSPGIFTVYDIVSELHVIGKHLAFKLGPDRLISFPQMFDKKHLLYLLNDSPVAYRTG